MQIQITKRISKTVFLLGIVSLLNDLSSEMIMAVLPLFITSLGGGGLSVGLIGGLEESVKSILSVFSGYWSDRFGRRKPFVFGGYTVSSLAKLALPISGSWASVLIFRLFDRVGKGIRTAPRDALIADAASVETRGINFGFQRAMDTGGALLGSIVAFLLFWAATLNLKLIILLGGIVAFISLLPLSFVTEKAQQPRQASLAMGLAKLSWRFRLNLLAMMLFALANFSYMFFLLKVNVAFTEKLAIGMPLLMYILFNLSYSSFALPAGVISDRIGRRNVLLAGYFLFSLVSLGFTISSSIWAFAPLFLLYGLAYAIIEGNQRAFAADLAVEEERGTALGAFHFAMGLAALLGSIFAGFIWQTFAPATTFFYGSGTAFAAAVALLLVSKIKIIPRSA